jgi:PHD/YefM family antitoxin component YafN of YafNO toxin-antitoxin module
MGRSRGGDFGMTASVIVDDHVNGKMYNISDLVNKVEWFTTIAEQPGKLTFSMIDDKKTYFPEGSRIAVTIGDVGLFSGFVFKRSRSESEFIDITAYDQMRYLQNKDIVNLPAMTSSEVFEKICREQELKYAVVHPSSYICPPRLHDNKTYYEMISAALLDTLVGAKQLFIIRDHYGVLMHLDTTKLIEPVIIGDNSLATGYTFESDIDSDTYNVVKLVKDNKDTAKREVYIEQNSEMIAAWGRLQYFESMDEAANEAQIIAKARRILELKNRPTRSLSLTCMGDYRVRAGNTIILDISALTNEKIPSLQNVIVMSCTHSFENDKHIMSLDLEVI